MSGGASEVGREGASKETASELHRLCCRAFAFLHRGTLHGDEKPNETTLLLTCSQLCMARHRPLLIAFMISV